MEVSVVALGLSSVRALTNVSIVDEWRGADTQPCGQGSEKVLRNRFSLNSGIAEAGSLILDPEALRSLLVKILADLGQDAKFTACTRA